MSSIGNQTGSSSSSSSGGGGYGGGGYGGGGGGYGGGGGGGGGGGPRGRGRGRGGGRFGRFGMRPKRVARPKEPLDYKNVTYLAGFVGPTGKMQSRRRTGFSGQNQRKLSTAIRLARFMGLLPYVGTPAEHRQRRDY